MIDVWQKMYKICLQNSIKFKFSQGTAPDPAGGPTAPPGPQLDFVPTNQVCQTGYFLAATALVYFIQTGRVIHIILCIYTTLAPSKGFDCGITCIFVVWLVSFAELVWYNLNISLATTFH